MGLCIGASVLSLVEFLDLLLLGRVFGDNNKVTTDKDSKESTIKREQTTETAYPKLYKDDHFDNGLSILKIPHMH
jgi:hypothetical protein